jgi:hypothetical protein
MQKSYPLNSTNHYMLCLLDLTLSIFCGNWRLFANTNIWMDIITRQLHFLGEITLVECLQSHHCGRSQISIVKQLSALGLHLNHAKP